MAGREAQTDEERSEKSVHCAGFVEAHLVDELFKDEGIVGIEIDAPLPVVEADGA